MMITVIVFVDVSENSCFTVITCCTKTNMNVNSGYQHLDQQGRKDNIIFLRSHSKYYCMKKPYVQKKFIHTECGVSLN